MNLVRIALATTVLVASGALGSAIAQQRNASPPTQRPVIINDPSLYRPPPMPPERSYYEPPGGPAPPMQGIPEVAPLAQPPLR